MGRLLTLLAIFAVGMSLTALLTVAWMLVLTYGKKKLDDMNGEKWDDYFRGLPTWGYVVRGLLFLTLALWSTVPLVYAAFRLFHFTYCGELAAVFAVLTAGAVVLRGLWKRKSILAKLQTMKT